MKKILPVLYAILFLCACKGGGGESLTCRVGRGDFREEVVADGTAQSVSTQTITSAPSPASALESSRPSVVPEKITSFMAYTPAA